jgi:N-glycosylase/DNA lyase
MAQRLEAWIHGEPHVLEIPSEEQEVIASVRWGRVDHIFTPAFWLSRVWYQRLQGDKIRYRLGETLREEIVACLLGGYGLPAEVGLAAFDRLKERSMLLRSPCDVAEIRSALIEPLNIRGKAIHYRYPNQRSQFIALALQRLDSESAPNNDLDFRKWLLSFQGIGWKTASWITRNHLESNNVAVLDIHVYRAGLLAGLFSSSESVTKHYTALEAKLITFSKAIGAALADLDALIWCEMRQMGSFVLESLRRRNIRGNTSMPVDA